MYLDQCSICEPRNRVLLEQRPDGVFACPHRQNWRKNGIVGTITLGAEPAPDRYVPRWQDGYMDPASFGAIGDTLNSQSSARATFLARAERAEKRCEELSAEVDSLDRTNRLIMAAKDNLADQYRTVLRTIASLRANLADANAREANHESRPCHPGHSCPSPLGNPTREEAIEALRRIRDRIQRFREGARFDRVAEMVEEEIGAVVPE